MKKQRTRKCATHLDSQRIPFGKNGTRCLECLNDRVKKQESKYLLKAKLVHGNEFDYSLFHFKELKEKVKIIARIVMKLFERKRDLLQEIILLKSAFSIIDQMFHKEIKDAEMKRSSICYCDKTDNPE